MPGGIRRYRITQIGTARMGGDKAEGKLYLSNARACRSRGAGLPGEGSNLDCVIQSHVSYH